MAVPYYVHAGARLRRILRQKEIIILHYAKKAELTPQGLYRYFSQPSIKRSKLEVLLEAIPVTMEEFYQWNSLDGSILHQGELLQLYLAQNKITTQQLANKLELDIEVVSDWLDTARFSHEQLQLLQSKSGIAPAWFTDPQQLKQDVNWVEAYLDKCAEAQQYARRLHVLEKKLQLLETR